VHQELVVNRLFIAFAVYAVLGILAWTTLSDFRIRMATFAILALFAVKSWVRRRDVMHPDRD
jgi:membrane protein implicated in regulation of membrane protease activity